MGLIDDVIAEDAQWQIHADLQFAETVTYSPQFGAGADLSIAAIVERNAPGSAPGTDKIRLYRYRVTVRNNATYGISAAATTILRGTITLAKRIGHAETETLTITTESLVAQDAGILTFAWD